MLFAETVFENILLNDPGSPVVDEYISKSKLLEVLLLQSNVTEAQLKLIGDEVTLYEFAASVNVCPIPALESSINPKKIYKILFFKI
jgi:hypothetical protein